MFAGSAHFRRDYRNLTQRAQRKTTENTEKARFLFGSHFNHKSFIWNRIKKGPRLGTRAPKDAFLLPDFFFVARRVGSSILASLSEAGGNDRHKSWSKPLPPHSKTCEDRLLECVHVFVTVHAGAQFKVYFSIMNSLMFVHVLAWPLQNLLSASQFES